jgi:hypothetical protein
MERPRQVSLLGSIFFSSSLLDVQAGEQAPLRSGPAQPAGSVIEFQDAYHRRWPRRLSRRLITLIFAGRNRIIVIRRELPRTKDAGRAR